MLSTSSCLSACISSAPTRRIFVKLDIGDCKKNCRENEYWLKSDQNIKRIARGLNSTFILLRRLINILQPAKSAKRKHFCLSVVTPLPVGQQLYKVRHCWFFMATTFRRSSRNIMTYEHCLSSFPSYTFMLFFFSFFMFFPLTAFTFLKLFLPPSVLFFGLSYVSLHLFVYF
jgi:hypothetical protein